MTTSFATMQVSDDEMSRFTELIYTRTGIRIVAHKKTLLSNRIRRRLRQTGITSFEQYYRHLKNLRPQDPEWDWFLQEITTHETYLFRDEIQWDWFRNQYLPSLASEALAGKRRRTLRIWSAACSTGDEVITIACCVAAMLPNLNSWKVKILGTDIGVGALEQAASAVFGERAMKLVPEDFKRRFFNKAPNAHVWHAKPQLTDLVEFRQHNLLDPLREHAFDVVFVKNVLIYFDPASKAQVLRHVKQVVLGGGYLIAGATEGVSEFVQDFQKLQPWLFRKP